MFYDIVYKRSKFSKKFLLDGGSVLNPGMTNYRSVYTSNNFISQTHQWRLSMEGFVKIARISIMMIQDRPKTIRTVSWWYHDDTGIVLTVILDFLLIPSDTNQYQVCYVLFGIGKYCKSIAKYHPVSQIIVRYCQELSQLKKKHYFIFFLLKLLSCFTYYHLVLSSIC